MRYLMTVDSINNRVFISDMVDRETFIYELSEWNTMSTNIVHRHEMSSMERQMSASVLDWLIEKEHNVSIDCMALNLYSDSQEMMYISRSSVWLYAPESLKDCVFEITGSSVGCVMTEKDSMTLLLNGSNRISVSAVRRVCSAIYLRFRKRFTTKKHEKRDIVLFRGIDRIGILIVSLDEAVAGWVCGEQNLYPLLEFDCKVSIGRLHTDLITSGMIGRIGSSVNVRPLLKPYNTGGVTVIIEPDIGNTLDLCAFHVTSGYTIVVDMYCYEGNGNFYIDVDNIDSVNIKAVRSGDLNIFIRDLHGSIKECEMKGR